MTFIHVLLVGSAWSRVFGFSLIIFAAFGVWKLIAAAVLFAVGWSIGDMRCGTDFEPAVLIGGQCFAAYLVHLVTR